jgi:hypothetical protein
MHVQMEHHLATFGIAVDYCAETSFTYIFNLCHFLRG